MSNFRRRLMMSFEKKYTPVKYLESTGTQYIDTGIKNDMNFGYIQSKFQITSTNESRYYIFGCYSNNANNLNRLQFSFSNPYFIGIGNNNSYTNSLANEKISTNPITVKLTTTQCIIDDEVIYTGTGYTTIPNSVNIYIFASNAGGSVSNIAKDIRIYNFNIYNNENELVRDFVPVIDSSGIPCLYDKVEDKFYYNQGTGEFLYE